MILLDPNARPVIAHRGNRAHAPENTIEAFQQAVAAGADAIEVDLRLTKDGEVVALHDPTLDRTTDSSGLVEMRSWDELKYVNAGARFSTDGGWVRPYLDRKVRVPLFNEIVDSLPSNFPMIIEIKIHSVSEPLRRIIKDRALEKRVVVAGFNRRSVHPLRGSGFPLGATMAEAAELVLPALRGKKVSGMNYDAICIPSRWKGVPVPITSIVRCVRDAGKVVHVWTVNSPNDAQHYWRQGVQGIVTDDPALMIAARKGI